MRANPAILLLIASLGFGVVKPASAAPPATLEILARAPGTKSTLTKGNDGNFYGTSYDGGAFGGGTIFRMAPSGQITILKSFQESTSDARSADGSHPGSRMVPGPDGRFYGSTTSGGSSAQPNSAGGDGTVFAITAAGAFTKIADVPPEPSSVVVTGKVRTYGVIAPLTFGQDGAIYGTREASIFRLSVTGNFVTIKPLPPGFGHTERAYDPTIVAGSDGYFYGTDTFGIWLGPGRVFRMDSNGTVTYLANSEDFSSNDDMPPAPMLEAADKNFYGFGEASTILKLDPATGTRTTLYKFHGPDGWRPLDSLIQAPDGNFYGTTAKGGANDPNASTTDDIGGTVFRLTPAGALTTLVSFDPVTGTAPRASLVQGNDGCFYGATSAKGPNGTGTIFRVTVFPPKLIAVIPRSNPNETKLVLHGQFFSGTTSVTVNGAPVISFVVDSPTQITATVSSAQVEGTVSVTTPLGSTSVNIDKTAPGSVLNLSSRLAVLPGDNALIGGFIITGSQPQKLLVRAMGPSLTKLGVTGALQDPTLELHNREGTLIASNDNWGFTQIGGIITSDQSTDIQNTGLAPTDGREAALLVTLDPGVYTAIQRGSNNTDGVGVVELYDLSPASSNAGLANISTRGFVTNDSVLIGGFIVGQANSARVIVRGLGPSLGALGVRNPLANPTIDLRDSNGAQIAFNHDWRDSQEQEINQTTIPPSDVHEAAIVATLAPGNYTAIVRSEDNATGTALVEIYNFTR